MPPTTPSPASNIWRALVNQTPDDFVFGLKVTDTITIKKFPKLDRFGEQAGKPNENFLNAELFTKAFLKPCEPVRQAVGLLMFEFFPVFGRATTSMAGTSSPTWTSSWGSCPKAGPTEWRCRNRNWLKPEYFECLARHQVTHVFNSWEAMPRWASRWFYRTAGPTPNWLLPIPAQAGPQI